MPSWLQYVAAGVVAWCALSLILGLGLGLVVRRSRARASEALPVFAVTSADVEADAVLDRSHLAAGVGGDDVSPQLAWSGFPGNTSGFAVTCRDADARSLRGSWRWAVADLPASTTALSTGAGDPERGLLPSAAVMLLNDERKARYTGPRPVPARTHRVVFVVHALDVADLGVRLPRRAAALSRLLAAHALGRGELVVRAEVWPG